MRTFLSGITACLLLLVMCVALKTSYAGTERSPAAVMQEHMKTMERKSPALYRSMVEDAGGNVTGCISCHKIQESKKSHFHFQAPENMGNMKK